MNIFLLLHLVILILIFLFATVQIKPGKRYVWVGNPLSIVLLIYLVSAFASFFVPEAMLSGFDYSLYGAVHYIGYTLFVSISLLPILLLKGRKYTLLQYPPQNSIRWFFLISSFSIWLALIYQIPYAITAISIGAEEIRHGLNVLREGVLPPTFLTTFSVVTSSFYVLFIFMFFYAVANRMSFFYIVSTFVGGTLYVVSSICFTARDGALFYMLTVLFAYIVFRSDLPINIQKRLSKAIVLAVVVISSFLVIFTAQRFFSTGDTQELLAGTLGYIGQQPFVFAETIVSQTNFYGFDLRFPLISILLTGAEVEVVRSMPYEWSFGTFLKDYYSMFGWPSLITMTVIQFLFFYSQFSRKKKTGSLAGILIVAFYFQFMLSGVFYFRLGTRGGNLYMVIYALLVIVVLLYSKSLVSSKRRLD